jgi:glycosyltransferase involved in cell wall biosynthesis
MPIKNTRIAIIADNPVETMGGLEKFSVMLGSELRKRGATVTLCDSSVFSCYRERWFDRLGLGIPRRTWLLGRAAGRTFKSEGMDIIIQNGISGWSLRSSAAGLPRIVVHHGTFRGLTPKLLSPDGPLRSKIANRVVSYGELGTIEKWTSGNATSVAVSPSVATELRDMYGRESIVIPNGVNLQQFVPGGQREARERLGLEISPESVMIVFVGRLEYGKGSDLLRELAQRALEELPEIRFLLCTDREQPGWPTNSTFLTNLPHDHMPQAYAASDIFLLPSRYEGCSLSVIEAMACGLAPLLSNVGHAQGISKQASALRDYIMPDFSLESWWPRLALLVRSPEEREQCAAAARRQVETHHSQEAMGDAYEELIQELLGGTL